MLLLRDRLGLSERQPLHLSRLNKEPEHISILERLRRDVFKRLAKLRPQRPQRHRLQRLRLLGMPLGHVLASFAEIEQVEPVLLVVEDLAPPNPQPAGTPVLNPRASQTSGIRTRADRTLGPEIAIRHEARPCRRRFARLSFPSFPGKLARSLLDSLFLVAHFPFRLYTRAGERDHRPPKMKCP